MKLLDLLNKLKWDKKYDFSLVRIWYVSRGEIDDISYIDGNDIEKIGGLLETKSGKCIPLHRIIKVEYKGKEIWKR